MSRERILLVEDENLVALEIADLLKGLGYQVCGQASSGERAIEKAATTDPDLVLMDIRLKGNLDGIDPQAMSMELIGKKVEVGNKTFTGDKYSAGESAAPVFRPVD